MLDQVRNVYATVARVKGQLGLASTSYDADILYSLEAVSRAIDDFCDRAFFPISETRYFGDAVVADALRIDDVLTITTLKQDTTGDGTFNQTWTAGTDYVLAPYNSFPKWEVRKPLTSEKDWCNEPRAVEIDGVWGYRSTADYSRTASDTSAAGIDDSATTLELDASAADIQAGHTIVMENEQMFVAAVSGSTLTLARGVNGTAAAAHAGATAISIITYEPRVVNAAILLVELWWHRRGRAAFKSERIGDYSVVMRETDNPTAMLEQQLWGLEKRRA